MVVKNLLSMRGKASTQGKIPLFKGKLIYENEDSLI